MENDSLNRRDAIVLAAIVAGAAALRFIHIGQESLWLDEGVSVGIARLPWLDFFKLMWHREGNMTLYYLLLRGWMLFASGEGWVRALSAGFSTATTPFIYLVGRDVRSRSAGLVAALLFAVSPFAIHYAQEARSYSLVCLLVTLATWFLLGRNWKWWAIMMGLAVYAHFFAMLVLAAHLLYLLLTSHPLRELRPTLAKLALALVPAAAFVELKNLGQLNWIPRLSVAGAKGAFGEFAGGGDLALIVLFLTVIAAILTWQGPVRTNRTLLVWLWLLVPIGVIVLVSVLHPLLVSRFLMISLPALMLAAGIALTEVPRPIAALLLLAIIFFSMRTEVLARRTPTKDDWRAATAYVLSQSSSQDGIIFHLALGREAFEYYAGQEHGMNRPQVISPARSVRITYRDFEDEPEEKLATKLEIRRPTLWVMLSRNEPKGKPDEYTESLMTALKLRYSQCTDEKFRGVSVMRCTP